VPKGRLEAFSDGVIAILIWLVPDRRVERHVSATAAESQE
jgi:hypothetical protein